MKKMLYFVAIVLMVGCSPKLTTYTVGIEKRIPKKEAGVQYYTSGELVFTMIANHDSLDVNYKGEIEELRNRSSSTFRVKANTPGILTKKETIGFVNLYWIKFDNDDPRSVPFIATGPNDQDRFSLALYAQDNRLVQLNDKKWYRYQGQATLMVTKKFVDQIDNTSRTAKGVKIYGK